MKEDEREETRSGRSLNFVFVNGLVPDSHHRVNTSKLSDSLCNFHSVEERVS